MKSRLLFFVLLVSLPFSGMADHITGGELFYTFTGFTGGLYRYDATLKLYMRCHSGRSFNNPTIISVFDRSGGGRILDMEVSLSRQEQISLTSPDPCISNPPEVCYEIGYYHFSLALPGSPNGYVVAGQVNYRVGGIANLSQGYSQIGATYTAEIPGTGSENIRNNSARFIGSDLVIVCANNPFSYSFGASDDDKDSLTYSFCEAYRSSTPNSGGGFGGNSASPSLPPPYQSVPYGGEFYGDKPLGIEVEIDPKTGLITGIAPNPGIYVVTVCVQESRKGQVIAMQRKDLQISITSCNITAAKLQPEYMLCGDTKTIGIANQSLSPLINAYQWQFFDNKNNIVYNGTEPIANHTFADTGVYSIKLVINPGQRCTDSTTSLIRVFPGFVPDFSYKGICVTKPTIFTDASTTVYGTVNSWKWHFDDGAATSLDRNPTHTYISPSTKTVRLIATNTKGCVDTLVQQLPIVTNPPLLLAFKDTLICPPDALQLRALGTGTYTWSPNINLDATNTGFPIVSPTVTTTYYAELNDNGCLNRDSVRVRVTNQVNLQAMPDTTICQGDPIQLRASGNANLYSWTPVEAFSISTLPNPIATTHSRTTYRVTGSISTCTATDEVVVSTVPYPIANAGADTMLCFGTPAYLKGYTDGISYLWSPAASLSNATVANPIASPATTTQYILSAFDNRGCPKPGRDTVLVVVLPKIQAYAGRDTSLVVGQALQMDAEGGVRYDWWPATGLSATNIANPMAIYDGPHEMIRYRVTVYNEAGCADSAFIHIKVFNTEPNVFVPTAFTPNGDGRNDLLRPIAVGMQRIERFAVYNRYGQQVFSTTINGHGWDGKVNGQQQASGTYVWMVKAVDYTGKAFVQKGVATLVR